MRTWTFATLALVLSGCSHLGNGPGPTLTPGAVFLEDPVDEAVGSPYDILQASIQELNGSFVVRVEFRNFSRPNDDPQLPQVEARVRLESLEGTRWFYARNEPDFSRPPPHIKWVMGRLVDDEHEELEGICAENTATAPSPPYFVRMELTHAVTGLDDHGGRVTRLEVYTSDFANSTRQDEAAKDGVVELRGGPNPHDTCPLVAERER